MDFETSACRQSYVITYVGSKRIIGLFVFSIAIRSLKSNQGYLVTQLVYPHYVNAKIKISNSYMYIWSSVVQLKILLAIGRYVI